MLGVDEDVDRRIILANLAFKSLEALWKHRDLVNERIRIMSYTTIVESVLLYNCSTWALSESCAKRLDTAQRRMLRRVIGISMIDKMSNTELYARCIITPASLQVLHARWRMFGHALRLSESTPARKAMLYYFTQEANVVGRKGNFITIATSLSKEYECITKNNISNRIEYERVLVHDNDHDLVNDIVQFYSNKYDNEVERRRLARHQAQELRAYLAVSLD